MSSNAAVVVVPQHSEAKTQKSARNVSGRYGIAIDFHASVLQAPGGPTVTKARNEENVRRYITDKMVSEFGATLGCKGCLVIGQPHTEECRARITKYMENGLAHAKRLEDNLIRRNEFANPEPEAAAPNEGRTDATKRARPEESAKTGGTSSCTTGADVDMRSISAGKRPLEPGGGDDMVCG